MANGKKITIKLCCSSLSKVVSYVARDDQRLDLGSIASTFGLDPWSLKLNGHFISRGPDLISSSLTWNSLLSFFSSRSLPTGAHDSSPLLVDGRLCRPGSKSTWLYALFFFTLCLVAQKIEGKETEVIWNCAPFFLSSGWIFYFLFFSSRFLSNQKVGLGFCCISLISEL